MTWTKRSPTSFPAHFARVMQEAFRFPDQPVLFGSYQTEGQADKLAMDFRYYRWCLREQPGVQPLISALENTYQIRMSRTVEDDYIVLYLTLKPTKLSFLIALNPHLADCLAE